MKLPMMIFVWACVLLLAASSDAALHPSSPCPSVFTYEGAQPEHERWYGIVLLSTDESLVGMRIDVKLDRPAEILVSWMGTVTTNDNELFTILSLDQKLHPGPATPSRFMVKFNALKGSPQVRTVRLNGRQICPPDPNFATDVQPNNQDHLYENRYTTERVTRRPDLDFDDDWTNSRPANPAKPPKRQNPGQYSSSGAQSSGVYSSMGTQSSGGYSGTGESTGYHSHETSGYNNQRDKDTSSGSYNSQVNKDRVRTTTYNYDNQEPFHSRPSANVASNSYVNTTVSGNRDPQSSQNNPRPSVTYNTDYNNPARPPSININIHKDVTYNVEKPETHNYNGDENPSSGASRPQTDREPSYANNQYPKTTERYNEQNNGGVRDEFYSKPTTKKPVVFSNINIHINSGDLNNPGQGSNYNPDKSTTTRKPYVSTNKNNNTNSNNNRLTTRRPTASSSEKPSSVSGYQSSRPNRNPEIASSESQYQPGIGQNGFSSSEKTTEKNNQGSYQGQSSGQSNYKPSSTGYNDNSRPSAIPSSRPDGGEENMKIPRPQAGYQTTTGPRESGDLAVANSRVKCGRVEVNPAPLITHGQNTARGQWPWHIALYRIEGINLSYSCGGSLISSTVVVTAAHCVTKAPRDRPVDADILVVQLGKYHLYQFSDDSVQNKQVQNVYVHPRYNSSNYLDDIALLVLSSPAEFTKYVRPVCLWPRHNFNLQNIDNKEGTVVGWGYDENNQVTEELKMARMPVVSYVTCLKSYPQFFSQFTAENKTFCAGFRQGTSVCNGDSGGGMVFQQDGVWYLRGLVSITVAKQGLRVCDTNHYVVFTDVSNYVDWIDRYIS